ncbi:MAG: hypothetical protein ABI129_03960 [Rhodanobacter sp.]
MSSQMSRDRPMLGAHTLLAQPDWRGSSPVVTQPVATEQNGSALLVLNGGFVSNDAMPIDNYARRWRQVGTAAVYDGYEGRFDVKAYVSAAGQGGAGHTVRIDKKGEPDREITVPFIEIRHAGVLQDFAQNYPKPDLASRIVSKASRTWRRLVSVEPTSSFKMTSGEVATTGPAVLIAVWWGDGNVRHMSAVPDDGFKVIDSFLQLPPESGVQCAVAYRQVGHAGTYHVTWTGSPRQRAILWLFAFQASPE